MANVGTIAGGGFRLIGQYPKAVAVWAGVQILVGGIVTFLMLPQMAGFAVAAPPGELPANFGSMIGMILLVSLVAWFANAVLSCAVYRAVLRPDEGGIGFVRVGGDEFRMLGLYLLFAIGGMFGWLVVWLGMMLLIFVLSFVLQSVPALAAGLTFLLVLAFICGLIYIFVRLSMVFPMTFLRRKFSIDEGWKVSAGRFWTLFGAYLLIIIGMFVVGCVLFFAFFGDYFAEMMQAASDPEAMKALQAEQMREQAEMPLEWRGLLLVGSAVVQAVMLAITAGATATALRELLADAGGEAALD